MGWVKDSGYEPAYKHEGWAGPVLDNGTDGSEVDHQEANERTTGWRPACECGWRGQEFYPRAEFPGIGGGRTASDEVMDLCMPEWERHIGEALPELAVYEFGRAAEQVQADLARAVVAARAAGASWATIGRAAGVTRQSAHERWSSLTA